MRRVAAACRLGDFVPLRPRRPPEGHGRRHRHGRAHAAREARAVKIHQLAVDFSVIAAKTGEPVDIETAEILSAAALHLYRGGKGPGSKRLANAARVTLDSAERSNVFERAVSMGRVPTPKQSLIVLRMSCKSVVEYLQIPQPMSPAERKAMIRSMAALLVRFATLGVPGLKDAPDAAQARLESHLTAHVPKDADHLLKWTLEAFGQPPGWIHRRLAGDRQTTSRAARKRLER